GRRAALCPSRARHWVPACALCAFLVGCASEQAGPSGPQPRSRPAIPLPHRALLTPPTEPGCGLKPSPAPGPSAAPAVERSAHPSAAGGAPPARSAEPWAFAGAAPPAPAAPGAGGGDLAPSDPSGLAARIRLEYERACYEHAERDARAHLKRLQVAIARTMRAIRRLERDGP